LWVEAQVRTAALLLVCLSLPGLKVLEPPTKPITKRILLLVDVSGSMQNFGHAQQALRVASAIARQPVDEASVLAMAWTDATATYPGGWVQLPSEEGVEKLEAWLGSWHTQGDTKLSQALRVALARPESDLTVIVVTDGDLHADSEAELLAALEAGQKARKQRATVGVWGIGHDKPLPKLLALAKAGGGGYVVGE